MSSRMVLEHTLLWNQAQRGYCAVYELDLVIIYEPKNAVTSCDLNGLIYKVWNVGTELTLNSVMRMKLRLLVT